MLVDNLLEKGLSLFAEEDQDSVKNEFFEAVKETTKLQA